MRINKKNKIELKYKIIIFIMIFVLLLVILFFSISRKELSPPESFFKGIVNKIQQVIYPSKKDDNKSLEAYKIENDTLKKELKELKKTMNIKYDSYESIYANVLYRDVGYWYDDLTIDKGYKDGIRRNMMVMTGEGIIGRVVGTTNYSSDVKLLTSADKESRITVGIVTDDKTIYGLIDGYDYKTKELLVNDIVDDTVIRTGMKVITSGLTDSYPEGILIGTVTGIGKDRYGLSKILKVTPSADFRSIRYVAVLKRSEKWYYQYQ